MFSRVHYFILILFRYRYSRDYIKTTTLCGNLYYLNILYRTLQHMFYETTLCFFAELELKILISVLFYRHTHDQKSKAEHWHHLSIKRGYQGDRMLSVGEKILQVSQYTK